MRILKTLLLMMALGLGMSSCMQHHGNIGHWFGTWQLTSIALDGAEDPTYEKNIFFQFQTDIVSIREVATDVSYTAFAVFGHWSEEGSTLTLDFTYNANGNKSGFTPPEQTYLQHDLNILHIVESSSRTMIWTYQYQDPDTEKEVTITYTLKKQ